MLSGKEGPGAVPQDLLFHAEVLTIACLVGSGGAESLTWHISIAVDASRLSRRSVLLGVAALPSNTAMWLPPQEHPSGLGRAPLPCVLSGGSPVGERRNQRILLKGREMRRGAVFWGVLGFSRVRVKK